MKTFTLLMIMCVLAWNSVSAQLVINELDSDTEGVDTKEFIEIKSDQPYFSLDGYVLVLFNGSYYGQDKSYFTQDLSGNQTDDNGILLLGSTYVQPFPQLLIPPNRIQNGGDAAAIYQASALDFEEGTPATTLNLVDALAYGTDDAEATSLLAALGLSDQIDEDLHNQKDYESIQRNPDGSYSVDTPTPRLPNDGSGNPKTPVEISVADDQYHEGDSFEIEFSTETAVSQDLNFDFILDNAGFDNSDFNGQTAITIEQGTESTSVVIDIIDDNLDEGDEQLSIQFQNLPSGYIPLNNQVIVRVVDDDYTTANFGTPVNPTYENVESTQSPSYYNSLDQTSGQELRDSLQAIVAEEGLVRAQTYADVVTILKKADQNPLNSNEVWLVYTEKGVPKLDLQGIINTGDNWNREHTFPRSIGSFFSIEDDKIPDGKNIYWNTNADSLRHGNSDAHALRAVEASENSSRSNQYYGEYNGPAGNAGSFKGDVARSVLFMALRYNDLSVESGFPEMPTVMGDLDSLLAWHHRDPPDDYEMNRNNIVEDWQKNRNPFIDQPELVDYIWGDKTGQTWEQELGVKRSHTRRISLYPNPNTGDFYVKGLPENSNLQVYSLTGKKITERHSIKNKHKISLDISAGMYLLKFKNGPQTQIRKMIVK